MGIEGRVSSCSTTGLRWIAAAQQLLQLPAVPCRKLDLKPYAFAHDSAIQPDLARAKHLQWLPIHTAVVLDMLCSTETFSPRISTLA